MFIVLLISPITHEVDVAALAEEMELRELQKACLAFFARRHPSQSSSDSKVPQLTPNHSNAAIRLMLAVIRKKLTLPVRHLSLSFLSSLLSRAHSIIIPTHKWRTSYTLGLTLSTPSERLYFEN